MEIETQTPRQPAAVELADRSKVCDRNDSYAYDSTNATTSPILDEGSERGLPSLSERGLASSEYHSGQHGQQFSLPPADGGKDAWLFLWSAFMLEALVWGFPSVFGVFQEYYSTHAPFAGSANIAVIGTCAMGIMYLILPVVFALLQAYPKARPWCGPIGLVAMCLSLALGSFAKTVTHLIITQGVLYALAGTVAWCPILFYIEEWFVRRRSFAFGIIFAGIGLAGAILPLVIGWLLRSYGHRTTLRACAIILFTFTIPISFFFKPRLPTSQTSQPRRFDLSFWSSRSFAILQAGNVIEALGFFLPSIYLPTYARSLGASDFTSVLTLILFSAGSVVGNLGMGAVLDRLHVTTAIFISTIGTCVAVFLLWGLATSLAPLFVFSFMYGLFAASWPATWPGIMKDVKAEKEHADPGMIFACLAAGKGIGNVLSGPLSGALVGVQRWKGAGMGYGSSYGALIVFTGVTAFFGGWGFVARRVGWI
ncbi:putative MFS monocarboxylate transporter [Aulographum hederae CBS 113979]|uniref:Putative MFS monocarboxylate transporter n=1 Tax=Aulographum hederae CBS 113979 TaxID=1176131 RepID=A0A6G1GKC9_9PEZI|nr:putative MFS monocarboxylate transporter [Aulographum hederae CBS 113979]